MFKPTMSSLQFDVHCVININAKILCTVPLDSRSRKIVHTICRVPSHRDTSVDPMFYGLSAYYFRVLTKEQVKAISHSYRYWRWADKMYSKTIPL